MTKLLGTWNCPHRTFDDIDPDLINKLHKIEEILGYDLAATRIVSCPECNKKVGGTKKSAHLKEPHEDKLSKAADIETRSGLTKFEIAREAFKVGITGIIIYERHIHLDIAKESDGYYRPYFNKGSYK